MTSALLVLKSPFSRREPEQQIDGHGAKESEKISRILSLHGHLSLAQAHHLKFDRTVFGSHCIAAVVFVSAANKTSPTGFWAH